MEKPIDWKTGDSGVVSGLGVHDGYFYGAVQADSRLTLYLKSYDDRERKIELAGITEMNITNFWIGSVIGDVCLCPSTKFRPSCGRICLQAVSLARSHK
jgi:hypothetical protein